ncbi:MAG: DUF4118 domain-containing protein [Gemmatimonadota bacterium]
MIHLGHATTAGSTPSSSGRHLLVGAWLFVPLILAGVLGMALRTHLRTVDLAMLMLLAVVVASSRTGPFLAALAALFAMAAFDILFVPPYYTLSVDDASYLLTFVVMLAVGLAVGQLTARLREESLARRRRSIVTDAALALTDELSEIRDPVVMVGAAARILADAIGRETRVLLADEVLDIEEVATTIPIEASDHGIRDALLPILAETSDHGTSVDGWFVQAIGIGSPPRGIVVISPASDPEGELLPMDMLNALVDRLGLHVDRDRWRVRHERAQIEIEAERLRTTLLSSVSHDLRTPLAAIEGAAGTLLLEPASDIPADVRVRLLRTIHDEADRMNRLIGNLLEMVRLESGVVPVHATWQPVEEVVGTARHRVAERIASHPLTVALAHDLPLVFIDELLFEQVLVNLLDNAIRHTPVGTRIDIRGRVAGTQLEIEVADRGQGFTPTALGTDFSSFARGGMHEDRPSTAGLGLGLSICQGIMIAHGGTIRVRSRAGGGTALNLRLPLGDPPAPPPSGQDTD